MYENQFAPIRYARLLALVSAVIFSMTIVLQAVGATPAAPQVFNSDSVVCKISGTSEKLELTTNTSRILTLDKNIPRVQVNNPELLAVTPLSATQVQISAKKAGVTQVNLWDEDGAIHSVDVQIFGDARELTLALQTQFPHASIRVYRYSESLVLTGFVDRPDHISSIMQLAQDYAPKVIDNITVGGVQQVLLKVKVMEVSRTKLRRLSTDFTYLNSNGSFFSTGVSGLLNQTSNVAGNAFQTVTDTTGKAAEFGIVGNNAAFFGFLDWLQQNNIAKILAEPNITAVSGRPAQFNVGGEIPIVVPQSLGTASIEYKPFGTQVDFLPIVLGNGKIRLEVRPRISEIDESRSVTIQDFVIPALTVRQVDTAIEMGAGQTFAVAGLVQERTKSLKRGLPFVMDLPVVGVPFRKTEDEVNEIELLILVTPEFVDPIESGELPCNGPGSFSTVPTNRGLYCAGQIEVPTHCNPTSGLGACGQDPCGNPNCNTCGQGGCANGNCGSSPAMSGQVVLPGGTGYDDGGGSIPVLPPAQGNGQLAPEELSFPVQIEDHGTPGKTPPAPASRVVPPQPGAKPPATPPQPAPLPAAPPKAAAAVQQGGVPEYSTPRPYSPQRQPVFMRNASNPATPTNPQGPTIPETASATQNGLIGPVGYDVQ